MYYKVVHSCTNAEVPDRKTNSRRLLWARMTSITADNFTDRDFSLTTLASVINYDPKYLSTVFKKERKLGYREYLRDMRLRHASFSMEQGIVSVKNIALLSGFSDALYFSKVFKEHYAVTPTEYIKTLNKRKDKTT